MEEKHKGFQEVIDLLISHIRVRENEQGDGEDEIWRNIEGRINRKEKIYKKPRFYIISAVAASLLLLIVFSDKLFFFQNQSDALNQSAELLSQTQIDSSQIQIYMSPHKKVTVEEPSAEITYSPQGRISINEETHEKDEDVEIEYNHIVVPKGKYTHLTLSDGSILHVNSGTRVTFPRVFSSDKREIYVDGEVCLKVKKNEKTPFVVKTDLFEVKVLGTTFNVNAYKGNSSAEVVLVDGSVQLFDLHKNKIKLKPDELIKINDGKAGLVQKTDASEYIAWTNGLMILQSEPLSKVAKRLEHYYGVQIRVTPEAESLKLKGKIDVNQSLEEVLRRISTTVPVSLKNENGIYTIFKVNN